MMWVVFAALTALAMAMVLHPLLSSRRSGTLAAPSETEFYRQQLAEIERDAARGMLSQADAESARVEAARRLLHAAPDAGQSSDAGPFKSRLAAAAILLLVPLAAVGLYLKLGQPDLPDQPLAARANDDTNVEAIVAKVEKHLRDKPDDGRGHEVLAPVYMRLGRFEQAENAYSETIRILGATPARLIGLAEARATIAQGVITDKAREALEQAVKLDPKNPQAQFMLAVAAEQDQQPDKARAIYDKILAESTPTAPWVAVVKVRLAGLGGDASAAAPAAPQGGPAPGVMGMPSGAAAEAVAALPPDEQKKQIRAMVEGLAARMAQNGQDVQGWLRLIRAWKMLDETDKARGALVEARKALAADAPALTQVEGLAKELGLGG